jgi:hypothetical protein
MIAVLACGWPVVLFAAHLLIQMVRGR